MAFIFWFTKSSSTWPLALAPCVGDHCLCLAHPMSFRWSEKKKTTMELDGYGHRSKPFKKPSLVPCFSYWCLAYGSSSPISMVLIYFEPKSIKSGIRPHLQIQMQKSNGVFTWFSVKYVKSRFFHARTTTIIWISPPNQALHPAFGQAFGLRLPVERMQCPWEPGRLRGLVAGP